MIFYPYTIKKSFVQLVVLILSFPLVTSRWHTVNMSYFYMAISPPVENLAHFWGLKSLEMAKFSEE